MKEKYQERKYYDIFTWMEDVNIQVIDLIADRLDNLPDWLKANPQIPAYYKDVIKYNMRWPFKDSPLEDLLKQRDYLNWLIEEVEKTLSTQNEYFPSQEHVEALMHEFTGVKKWPFGSKSIFEKNEE